MLKKGQLARCKKTGAIFKFEWVLDGFRYLAVFISQTGIVSRHVIDVRNLEALTEEEKREFIGERRH